MVDPVSAEMSLHKLALLTREFNRAMNLPEGASLTCVSENRVQEFGRMLREEVQEVEKAVTSGIIHEVLAELVDVLYLTLNLGQECGLEQWLESAFLMKRGDKLRKQHESITHLSWSRSAHASVEAYCLQDNFWEMAPLFKGQAHQAV